MLQGPIGRSEAGNGCSRNPFPTPSAELRPAHGYFLQAGAETVKEGWSKAQSQRVGRKVPNGESVTAQIRKPM